jgi:hypothetical protein
MIRSLDKFMTGSIDWKYLATFVILLKSNVVTEKQIEEYKKEFKKKDDA